MKQVLGTGAIARICNVSPRTASKWIDSGALPGYRIPGCRARRVLTSVLVTFLTRHGMPLNELQSAEPAATN